MAMAESRRKFDPCRSARRVVRRPLLAKSADRVELAYGVAVMRARNARSSALQTFEARKRDDDHGRVCSVCAPYGNTLDELVSRMGDTIELLGGLSREKPALAQALSRLPSPKASTGPRAPAGPTPWAAAWPAAQARIAAVKE